ncbi:hypothetical protein VTO73DRAFT_1776 [Trametes versicolor]
MSSLLALSRARFPAAVAAEKYDIFTSLVDDMIVTLFDHAEVDSLVRFRSTGHRADAFVSSYLSGKLNVHLRRFVKNTAHFLDELEVCCSVISGSSALAILFRLPWTPQDLDIYTPRAYFYHVVAYLVHVEEYSVSFPRGSTYHVYGKVRNVARLTRSDGQRIDVVQSASNSPLLPIASFWTTAVMNYISATSFCIAYPHLTEANRSLISTTFMREADVQGVPQPTQHQELLAKYRERGFDLRLAHMSWTRESAVDAVCPGTQSVTCPLSIRYFGDRHCVTGSLRPVRTTRSTRKTVNLLEEWTAVWWRGGQTCGDMCGAAGAWVGGEAFTCNRSLVLN